MEILAIGVRHVDGVVGGFVCLIGGLFERVGAVVGLLRNGSDVVVRCGREEEGEIRREEKALCKSWCAVRQPRSAGAGRHSSSVDWRRKAREAELTRMAVAHSPRSLEKAYDRMSADAKRISANNHCGWQHGLLCYCTASSIVLTDGRLCFMLVYTDAVLP